MSEQYYATTLEVPAPPAAVQAAITDVRGWWSEEVEGGADQPGQEFVFHGHDPDNTVEHTSRIRVEAVEPGRLVSWRVLDNHMSFVTDQREWQGTEIRFELEATDSGTTVRFAHIGLVPAYECYDACSSAWSFFITQSLRDLITTGRGAPITPSGVSA